MKKIEEPAPVSPQLDIFHLLLRGMLPYHFPLQVAVVANKYAFLQEEDGVGSGEEQED